MTLLPSSFTLGLLLGQLSILSLLYLFIRYLLLSPLDAPSPPSPAPKPPLRAFASASSPQPSAGSEWLNEVTRQASTFILLKIVDAYRAELAAPPGEGMPPVPAGEVVRMKVERWINAHRSAELMDEIVVHDTDLGEDAPGVQGVRVSEDPRGGLRAEFDVSYAPAHPPSVSISTALLLNLPMPRFGSLPVSLSVALSRLSGTLIFHIPPTPTPITMHLSPTPPLQLSLSLSSFVGSRAKLADLPKLHELVESRVRSVLEERLGKKGEGWTFVLPGLGGRGEKGGVKGLARTIGEEVLGGEVGDGKEGM